MGMNVAAYSGNACGLGSDGVDDLHGGISLSATVYLGWSRRRAQHEFCPALWVVMGRQGAAMALHNAIADGQAQARSPCPQAWW